MNFKNKYLVHTIRTLLGLFLAYSGIAGLVMAFTGSLTNIPDNMIAITQAFNNSGLIYLTKIFESAAGIMLLINFRPALANIFSGGIILGATVLNLVLLPAFAIMSIIPGILSLYLAYIYWNKYEALFKK